ncbi:helix-turn-helix domain-containing protein [Zafaria sp. Z1313]|uniref:helix-turn-helix domain-containing protein n=1 Tax=Zafaria sp. Z1313 TaxID=3423202 RepID=UPI003D3037E2
MAGKEKVDGTTSGTVRANIARFRKARDLSYAQMSRSLDSIGWPILALPLRRIEDGTRRIDTDDLMAISIVLHVSPLDLLLPEKDEPGTVAITGAEDLSADNLWGWAKGEGALHIDMGLSGGTLVGTPSLYGGMLAAFRTPEFKAAVREAMRDAE